MNQAKVEIEPTLIFFLFFFSFLIDRIGTFLCRFCIIVLVPNMRIQQSYTDEEPLRKT